MSQNDLEWKLRIKVEGEKEADEKVNSIAQKAFESLNSKNFSLKEPGKEIKDFVEEHSKMFKQMRESKTLDIANLVWGKLNDPNASAQEKFRASNEMRRIFEDLHVQMENNTRKLQSRAKELGLNPAQFEGAMQTGLGSAYDMYANAGAGAHNMTNQMRESGQDHNGLRQYAKQAAMYMIGYQIAQLVQGGGQFYQASQMAGADISMRSNTLLDLNSIIGSRVETSQNNMSNVMQGLQLRKQGYEFAGSVAGGLLAAGLTAGGMALAGTGIGTPIGLGMLGVASMVGSSAGGTIGGILGTNDITAEMKAQEHEVLKNKFLGQIMPIAEQRVGVYDQLDTVRAKFRARTGSGLSGITNGLGYTEAEQYQLGLMQSGVTGHFNQNTFAGQTAFARANGYDPSEIYQSGIATRYTGQEVGANNLARRQALADQTGMGTRMPDLIAAINGLSVVMTKSGVDPTEGTLLQAANLPALLFGNSARGRMGDLGMETIMGINSAFQQQPGSAQDAFLFQATYGMHKGNLNKFDLLKEEGVFGQGNLRALTEGVSQYGGKETMQMVLKSLGMSGHLSKTFTDKAINEDGSVNKEFIDKFEKIDSNTEEGTQELANLLEVSKDMVSSAEKHKTDLVKQMADTGKLIADKVHEMQTTLVKQQDDVLKNQVSWDIITKSFQQGVEDFKNAVKKLMGEEIQSEGYEREKKINPYLTKDQYESGVTGDESNALYNLIHKKENFSPDKIKEALDGYDTKVVESTGTMNTGLIDADKKIFRWFLGYDNKTKSNKYYEMKWKNKEGAKAYWNIKDDKENEQFEKMNEGMFDKDRNVKSEWGGSGSAQGNEYSANIIINYAGASRANLHKQIDDNLDKLEQSSYPRKIENQFN